MFIGASALGPSQDPPDTTGALGMAGAGAGACDGCWMLPAEFEGLVLPADELDPEVPDEELDEAALLRTVRPWKEFEATSETSPVRATAPAIIHRLIRDTRARPRSRASIEAFLRTGS
jgi:hypothetical protein